MDEVTCHLSVCVPTRLPIDVLAMLFFALPLLHDNVYMRLKRARVGGVLDTLAAASMHLLVRL